DSYGNPNAIRKRTEPGKEVITTNVFDARSRLRSTSSTLGPSVSLAYDALDRIVSRAVDDPTLIRDSHTAAYSYKPAGQLSLEQTSGGGQSYSVEYGYDTLDRLTSTTEIGTGIGTLSRTYSYDGNSNVLTATDRRGVTSNYSYDNLNHVVLVRATGGT